MFIKIQKSEQCPPRLNNLHEQSGKFVDRGSYSKIKIYSGLVD